MMRWPWIERLFRLDSSHAILLGALGLLAIAALDYVTGTGVSMGTLYLLPILLVGWSCPFAWGLAFAIACAGMQAVFGLTQGYPHSHFLYFALSIVNRLITYVVALVLIWRLRIFHERERRIARIDHLTGIVNRRGLHETLERELRRHARSRKPLCVAYFDCDDFKSVNDRGGHAEGDRLLQAIAATLLRHVRGSDLVGRVGGDEFAVVFPETHGDALSPAIEKTRRALVSMCAHGGWPVTFSIGVVTFVAPPAAADAVIAAADETMYRAKSAGKDRVVYAALPA